MKKIVLLSLLICLSGFVSSQQVVEIKNEEAKWEYLVFTLGKTYFGSPQKSVLYSELIKKVSSTYQEGNNLEKCLDLLGEYGWELVNIIGSIAGDQQVVLKRNCKNYDFEKTQLYNRIVSNQTEEIHNSIVKEKENAKKLDYKNNTAILVDLDEVDRILFEKQRYESVKKDIESAFEKVNDINISMKYVIYNNNVVVDVEVDITEKCLKENTYRKVEVERVISEYNTLLDCIKVNTFFEYVVRINAFIKFKNENIYVGKGIKTNNYLKWINGVY